jgi:chaperonin GroES
MHLRPLHDRIIVRRLDEGSTQRIGGIIIDSAKEKPLRGTVLAAGVTVDGIDYLIMKEDDVLAVEGSL